MSNYGNWHGVDGLNTGEYVRARGENVNGEDLVELEVGDLESCTTLLFLGPEARQSLIAALAAAGAETTKVRLEEAEGRWGRPRS